MQTFDNTRPMVAGMAVGVARACLERTRELLRRGSRSTTTRHRTPRARPPRSSSRWRPTGSCVALCGSIGYGEGELLEKWARDAKILDLFEGTQQIQLLIVARQLLGKSSAELR